MCTAYVFFASEFQKAYRLENPDDKVTEGMKAAGAKWQQMTVEEKKPYEELRENDINRYEHEMK